MPVKLELHLEAIALTSSLQREDYEYKQKNIMKLTAGGGDTIFPRDNFSYVVYIISLIKFHCNYSVSTACEYQKLLLVLSLWQRNGYYVIAVIADTDMICSLFNEMEITSIHQFLI